MKKTAYNKGSLSFLFAFRGQFSQQFSHFHFSLILLYWPQYRISASPTSAHRVLFSHCPLPGSFYLQPGWGLPLHHPCVCPPCTVCLPPGSAAWSPNPTLFVHRLPAVHQELPVPSHSIVVTHALSVMPHTPQHTVPYPTLALACTLSIPKGSYNLCHIQSGLRTYSVCHSGFAFSLGTSWKAQGIRCLCLSSPNTCTKTV